MNMDFIPNIKKISTNSLRREALDILAYGLKAVHPHTLVPRQVEHQPDLNTVVVQGRHFDLISGRIFVAGAGEAAGAMAEALEAVIGARRVADGLVLSAPGRFSCRQVRIVEKSGLLSSVKEKKALAEMSAMAGRNRATAKDLLIFLSGGAATDNLFARLAADFAPARAICLEIKPGPAGPEPGPGPETGHFRLGGAETALEAMSLYARELGCNPIIGGADLGGDSADIGARIARSLAANEFAPHDLVLFGGQADPAALLAACSGGFSARPSWLALAASPLSGVGALSGPGGQSAFEVDASGLPDIDLALYILK